MAFERPIRAGGVFLIFLGALAASAIGIFAGICFAVGG